MNMPTGIYDHTNNSSTFKKGHPGYWSGKKRPNAFNGKRPSTPNWKGGITTQNKLDRERFRREIQKLVLERDNYTCQMCGVRGVALQVDHIQPWSEYVELRFDINNCRTLCDKCHFKITFGKEMSPVVKTWGQTKERRIHP